MDWMKWIVRGVFVAGGWIIAVGCDDDAETMLEGEFACGSDRCDAEIEYCQYPAESCEQGSGGLDGVPACVPFPDGCEPGCECLSTGPCTVRDGGVHLGSGQTCG